eukprot:m.206842 g.206842  ORF g.206842 m.206842 type:complete len:363 (-) comp18908_c0_seq29:2768-3856(-)
MAVPHQWLVVGVLLCTYDMVLSSPGDRSHVYRQCYGACERVCTDAEASKQGSISTDPPHARWCADNGIDPLQQDPWIALLWCCADECRYQCMWKIETDKRQESQTFTTVQYFGKWPFARFLGVQEPASTLFSAVHFVIHWKASRYFYRTFCTSQTHGVINFAVQAKRVLWRVYGMLWMFVWVSACAFHVRDTPTTEKFDYYSATVAITSTVLLSLLSILSETMATASAARFQALRVLGVGLTVGFVGCCCWHIVSMATAPFFDYGYHGKFNAAFVCMLIPIWGSWWWVNRGLRKYAWKPALFSVLLPMFGALELLDFPPIGDTLDAHSLWHGLTIPCALLWWSFVMDDMRYEVQTKPFNLVR